MRDIAFIRRSSPMVLAEPWPRSLVSTAMPDAPATVQRADQVVGGQLDVGEEDLVELGLAGHLLQRADLHAGRSIGKAKNEMPSCLGASGLVRAMRMPQLL